MPAKKRALDIPKKGVKNSSQAKHVITKAIAETVFESMGDLLVDAPFCDAYGWFFREVVVISGVDTKCWGILIPTRNVLDLKVSLPLAHATLQPARILRIVQQPKVANLSPHVGNRVPAAHLVFEIQ